MQNANIESLLKVAHAQWAYFRFGALIWRVCVCVCVCVCLCVCVCAFVCVCVYVHPP